MRKYLMWLEYTASGGRWLPLARSLTRPLVEAEHEEAAVENYLAGQRADPASHISNKVEGDVLRVAVREMLPNTYYELDGRRMAPDNPL